MPHIEHLRQGLLGIGMNMRGLNVRHSAFNANSHSLLHMAKLEPDAAWSCRAAETIENVLVETGISEHSNEWFIDCRSSICTVLFDTALADYDDDKASSVLMGDMFGQVFWRRFYREGLSYLVLLRSGYYIAE